ncbi:MAG: excinuclease ABC subunit UvrB [Bdellovibrionota bacterium]|jgi:excinuclease ABC subunit B
MTSFREQHQALRQDFNLISQFKPCGDQPKAIAGLNEYLSAGNKFQTLLGVTGSGKTFTIGNVIAEQKKPALVIAPNKTLAAQLYSEFRELFPNNNVRYFVSYYDYYQPEAYVPSTDTYIEKDAAVNEEIDKLRHSATRAILEYTDTIVVSSVSCIYGLGDPEDYFNMMLFLEVGDKIAREDILKQLIYMQYSRGDAEFERGNFRVRGESIDILPSDQDDRALRIIYFGDEIEEIREIDAITGVTIRKLERCAIYPVSHFVTDTEQIEIAIKSIRKELKEWLPVLRKGGKNFEADRLEQRTLYDLELLSEIGFCSGIENYSRHLTNREAGEPPTTLLDYFSEDFLLFIDESHVTVPQLGGMYRGDQARKKTLVDYGFRLPSALDNRPLNLDEFWERVKQVVFVSATPGDFEIASSQGRIVEQVNRPTGLLDPKVIVKPAMNQVDDLVEEIKTTIAQDERVLVTTLTKKMAENLSVYLREVGIKCRYLHSDIHTLERVEILHGLRKGDFDVLIGINLLREGLDLVEVSLVAILDADKEGFLRSTRSLIQTMGRAARNVNGRVIMYADTVTRSMKEAIDESERRRQIQGEFNKQHGIVPRSAEKALSAPIIPIENDIDMLEIAVGGRAYTIPVDQKEQQMLIEKFKKEMFAMAAKKEFEQAAQLRDAIKKLSAINLQ